MYELEPDCLVQILTLLFTGSVTLGKLLKLLKTQFCTYKTQAMEVGDWQGYMSSYCAYKALSMACHIISTQYILYFCIPDLGLYIHWSENLDLKTNLWHSYYYYNPYLSIEEIKTQRGWVNFLRSPSKKVAEPNSAWLWSHVLVTAIHKLLARGPASAWGYIVGDYFMNFSSL